VYVTRKCARTLAKNVDHAVSGTGENLEENLQYTTNRCPEIPLLQFTATVTRIVGKSKINGENGLKSLQN
jgi:hypothetical protein